MGETLKVPLQTQIALNGVARMQRTRMGEIIMREALRGSPRSSGQAG
jgi:hypothetical protein